MRYNELTENFSTKDFLSVKERVAAQPIEVQEQLAEALAVKLYNWVIGDGMVSDQNGGFVSGFKVLSQFVTTYRRRTLRQVFRGTRVPEITPELQAAAQAPGRHKLITSTKAVQSWSTKPSAAVKFSDPEEQYYARGNHGVLFATRASALPILFTTADVQDCLWAIVEGLDHNVAGKYSSLSHSQFQSLDYELEGFAGQNEVIVRTPPDGLIEVRAVKILK